MELIVADTNENRFQRLSALIDKASNVSQTVFIFTKAEETLSKEYINCFKTIRSQEEQLATYLKMWMFLELRQSHIIHTY